jgi:hypothetical protein
MSRRISSSVLVLLSTVVPLALQAQAQTKSAPDAKSYFALAESAAPTAIASKAAIVKLDAKGNVTTLREGSNDFACMVGVPGDPDAPVCMDRNATRWFTDATSGKPKPTNTAPGIAYMARGGVHYENASHDAVMESKGMKAVKEPAHWMVMWPFTPKGSGLTTKENPSGVYIMFAGTPYAHLMVYQNPLKMGLAGTAK